MLISEGGIPLDIEVISGQPWHHRDLETDNTPRQTRPLRLNLHAVSKPITADLDKMTMEHGEEVVSEEPRALPSSVMKSIDSSFGSVNALGNMQNVTSILQLFQL